MTAKILTIAAAGVLALTLAGTTLAAPGATKDSDPNYDLLDTSCGAFLTILSIANPGTNPSPERQAEAKAAQMDAYKGMIWAHGYMSGKAGAANRTPLTRAWLVKMVPVVAAECRKDPKQLLFTAIDKL